jgi:hypothetical protein
VFAILLQAILCWWAKSGYPEELPTKEANSSGMRQLVAAALAPRLAEDHDIRWFRVHDAVADYAVPEGEKQALRKKLWDKAVAPPCEDPAVKLVMEVMQEMSAELEDGRWKTQPGIDSIKELVRGLGGERHRMQEALETLFTGAILISLSPSAAKALVYADPRLASLDRCFKAHRQWPTLRWAALDWEKMQPDWYEPFYLAQALLPEEDIVRRVLVHSDFNDWSETYLQVRAQAT